MPSSSSDGKHPCDRCFRLFDTQSEVCFHALTCRANPKLTCRKCSKVFSNASNLQRHVNTCTGRKPLVQKCTHAWCKKTFSTFQGLQQHVKHCAVQGPEGSIAARTCTKCKRVLSSPAYCKQHETTCKGPDAAACQAACTKCNKVFCNAAYAKQHESTCKGPRAVSSAICATCQTTFSSLQYARKHELTCGKTFACSRGCGCTFAKLYMCQRHEKTCTFVAPRPLKFWCPVCVNKGFATRAAYDAHAQANVHCTPVYMDPPTSPLPHANQPAQLDYVQVVRAMRRKGQEVPACLRCYDSPHLPSGRADGQRT